MSTNISNLCGAKTNGGTPCRKPGTGAGGRCRLHGGATPSGVDSPHFKHGLYSKRGPTALKELLRLAQSVNTPTAQDEVDLLRARILDLLEAMPDGDPAQRARVGARLAGRLQAALDDDDVKHAHKLAGDLAELFADDIDSARAWAEVVTISNSLAKLIDVNRRVEDTMQRGMTTSRWSKLIQALLEAVRTEVDDPDQAARLVDVARRFLSAPFSEAPEATAALSRARSHARKLGRDLGKGSSDD